MMKQENKAPNKIVFLITISMILLVNAFSFVGEAIEKYGTSDDPTYVEAVDGNCEYIGSKYLDKEAKENTHFYRVNVTLTNRGNSMILIQNLFVPFYNSSGRSLERFYEQETPAGEYQYYYSTEPVLPSGRTVNASYIVMIPDDENEITVTVPFSDETKTSNVVTISVAH